MIVVMVTMMMTCPRYAYICFNDHDHDHDQGGDDDDDCDGLGYL